MRCVSSSKKLGLDPSRAWHYKVRVWIGEGAAFGSAIYRLGMRQALGNRVSVKFDLIGHQTPRNAQPPRRM